MNPVALIALCAALTGDPDSIVRGVYINPYQACKRSYLEKIFARADSGYINAIVVDLKSDYGYLCYASEVPLAQEMNAVKRYVDIRALVDSCRAHGVKLIARVVCFRDNYLAQHEDCGIRDSAGAVWFDKTGTAWVNPYVEQVHDYLARVVEELVKLGVRSFAFDYIRFPTDGNVESIKLENVTGPRSEPIINFLKKVRKKVDAEIGICIFGYAVWRDLRSEGQDIAKLGDHIDVVYPMLYPSHFPAGFKNEENEYWRNYWIYFDSVNEAFKKTSLDVRVVAFVQGFDLFADEFNDAYVFSQISGALGADADGILIWHAACNYSTSWRPLRWARNLTLTRYAQKFPGIRMRELLHQYQDRAPEISLSQAQTRTTTRTSPVPDTLIDIPPLRRIPRSAPPDQVLPW
jgi:hypothetical protein